jgi:hypothetical protein
VARAETWGVIVDWCSSRQEEIKNINIKKGTKYRHAGKNEGRNGDRKMAKNIIVTALGNLEIKVKLSLCKP